MLLNPVTVHTPKTIEELNKLYHSLDSVKLHAGGTFLVNSLKLIKRKGAKTAANIIALNKIDQLRKISASSKELKIGSMVTIADLYTNPELTDNFAILKTVCKNISTQPIRNMASFGGNLTCRYTWTEIPAVVIGLQGKLHFIDKKGKEEVVDPEDFFKNAAKTDLILTHVTIPREKNVRIAYRRVKKTQFVDIPMLSLLIKSDSKANKFTNTIVSINNCTQFAQRDYALEKYLDGQPFETRIAQEALDHLDKKIYDTRSSEYKQHMFRLNIKNALTEIITQKN
jgi:CO/xanthine dehydrogenase FAD-binding subunit